MLKKFNPKNLPLDRKFNLYSILIAISSLCIWRLIWYKFTGVLLNTYPIGIITPNYFSYGLTRRGLLGTLFNLIPGEPSILKVYLFHVFFYVLFCVLLNRFIVYVLGKSDNSKFVYTIGICSFILLCSTYSFVLFGYPDILIFIFVILQAFIFLRKKHEGLIIILSIFCILTHEGFGCMCASVSLILLFISWRENKNAKYLIYFIINTLTILFLTVFILKQHPYTPENYISAYNMGAKLGNISYHDIYMQIFNIDSQTISDLGYSVYSNFNDFQREVRIQLLLFIPILIPVIIRWVKISTKQINIISGIIIGLIGVQFYLYCDFGRYFSWIVFCMVITLLSLYKIDYQPMRALVTKSAKKPVYKPLLYSYCLLVSPFMIDINPISVMMFMILKSF